MTGNAFLLLSFVLFCLFSASLEYFFLFLCRTLLQETQRRKAEEEQEMRASFSVSLQDKTTGAGAAVGAATTSEAFSRHPSESRGVSLLRSTPQTTPVGGGGLRRMVSETGAPAAVMGTAVISGGAVGGLRRMTSATGDPAFPRRTSETGGHATAGSNTAAGGGVGGAVGGLRRMSSLTGEQASRATFNVGNARPPVSRFSSTKEGDQEFAVNNPMRK